MSQRMWHDVTVSGLYSGAMQNNQNRTLHLIDIENLVGSPDPSARQVRQVRDHYEPMYVRYGDQVVVACSHHAFGSVAWEWPRARHVPRSGKDGADLALLGVITGERVAERFQHVMVASGDAIFADAVARLGMQGVNVTVIARHESFSRTLQLASRQHLLLPCLDASNAELPESA